MYSIYLRDEIIVRQADSHDKWNTESYVDDKMKARVDYKTKFVSNNMGEKVESQMQVIMPNRTLNKHKDKIIFEDETYPIIKVERLRSWNSKKVGSHLKLYLGSAG